LYQTAGLKALFAGLAGVPLLKYIPVPKKLRLGWLIYEEIGPVIINDYAVARVTVGD